jgi:C4-dicarboxylate-specific signal transduction histidine kinase
MKFDKIFQPPSPRLPDSVIQAGGIRAGFFTTKPAGQGTRFGLSLSYDIVIAHGGKLKMVTKGGEVPEFIILLSA